jgi:hypothetical protein
MFLMICNSQMVLDREILFQDVVSEHIFQSNLDITINDRPELLLRRGNSWNMEKM